MREIDRDDDKGDWLHEVRRDKALDQRLMDSPWHPLSDPPTEAGVYLTRKAHGIPAVSPWRPEDGDVVEWWGRLGTVEWMRIPD